MFSFKSKQRRQSFICVSDKNAIQTIYEQFTRLCSEANMEIPKSVDKEFKLRSDRANDQAAKAKLNFSKCKIDDELLAILFQAMSVEPRISKIDLEDNLITDKGAAYILRLLKGQAKLIRNVHIDNRADACFFGNILLKGNEIDGKTLQNIKLYSDALEYANAQTFIYNTYKQSYPSVPMEGIDAHMMTQLFELILKRKPKSGEFLQACYDIHGKSVKATLTYMEMEKSFIQVMITDGGLTTITSYQLSLITFNPPAIDSNASVSNSSAAESGVHPSLAHHHPHHGSDHAPITHISQISEPFSSTEQQQPLQEGQLPIKPPLPRTPPVQTEQPIHHPTHSHSSAPQQVDDRSQASSATSPVYVVPTAEEVMQMTGKELRRACRHAGIEYHGFQERCEFTDALTVYYGFPLATDAAEVTASEPDHPVRAPTSTQAAEVDPAPGAEVIPVPHTEHPAAVQEVEEAPYVAPSLEALLHMKRKQLRVEIMRAGLDPMEINLADKASMLGALVDYLGYNDQVELEVPVPEPVSEVAEQSSVGIALPASTSARAEETVPVTAEVVLPRKQSALHGMFAAVDGEDGAWGSEEAVAVAPVPTATTSADMMSSKHVSPDKAASRTVSVPATEEKLPAAVSVPGSTDKAVGRAPTPVMPAVVRPGIASSVSVLVQDTNPTDSMHAPFSANSFPIPPEISIFTPDSITDMKPPRLSASPNSKTFRRSSSTLNNNTVGWSSDFNERNGLTALEIDPVSGTITPANDSNLSSPMRRTSTCANIGEQHKLTTPTGIVMRRKSSIVVVRAEDIPQATADNTAADPTSIKPFAISRNVSIGDDLNTIPMVAEEESAGSEAAKDEIEYQNFTVNVLEEIPTCYDFTNQNICGDDWFTAIEAPEDDAANPSTALIRAEIVPKSCYQFIQTLILQRNNIECFNWDILFELNHLIELDLSYNKITHIIDSIVYMGNFSSKVNYKILAKKIKQSKEHTATSAIKKPLTITESEGKLYLHATLKRLDVSHNRIEKCTGLVSLVALQDLNISHNCIRVPEGIPFSTARLDISNNNISSMLSLRMLGLCKKIVAIDISENPLGSREILVSILPGLLEYNGITLPRSHDSSKRSLSKAQKKIQEAQVLRYERTWQKQSKSTKQENVPVEKPDKALVRKLQHMSDVTRSTVQFNKRSDSLDIQRELIGQHFEEMSKSLKPAIPKSQCEAVFRRLSVNPAHYNHPSPPRQSVMRAGVVLGGTRCTDIRRTNTSSSMLSMSKQKSFIIDQNRNLFSVNNTNTSIFVNTSAFDNAAAPMSYQPLPVEHRSNTFSSLFNDFDEVVEDEEILAVPLWDEYIQLASQELHKLIQYIQTEEGEDEHITLEVGFMNTYMRQFGILSRLKHDVDTCLKQGQIIMNMPLVTAYHYILKEAQEMMLEGLGVDSAGVEKKSVLDMMEYLLASTEYGVCVQQYLTSSRNPPDASLSANISPPYTNENEYPELDDPSAGYRAAPTAVVNETYEAANVVSRSEEISPILSPEETSVPEKPAPVEEPVIDFSIPIPAYADYKGKSENPKLSALDRIALRVKTNKEKTMDGSSGTTPTNITVDEVSSL